MTDREALLAAVVADPDNDLPRLMYADWCDEHGDPDRAEFVRSQVAMARLKDANPKWHGYAARSYILASRGAERWLAELPTPDGAAWPAGPLGVLSRDTFDRGFLHRLTVTDDALLAHGRDLFAAAPVRHLLVGGTVGPFHLAPLPAGLWELELGVLTQAAAQVLERDPRFAGLRRLGVGASDLTPADRSRLAARFGDRLSGEGVQVTTRRRRRR